MKEEKKNRRLCKLSCTTVFLLLCIQVNELLRSNYSCIEKKPRV